MESFQEFHIGIFKERLVRKAYTIKQRLGNYCKTRITSAFCRKREQSAPKKVLGLCLFTCSSKLFPLSTNFAKAYFIIHVHYNFQ